MKITSHDKRNLIHQWKFYLIIFIIYILVILFMRHRNENRLRRNDLFNEMTCEQYDRKLRVSSNMIVVIVFASKRAYITIKVYSFLFEEKWIFIFIKLNSKLKWIIIYFFMFFFSVLKKSRIARTWLYWMNESFMFVFEENMNKKSFR